MSGGSSLCFNWRVCLAVAVIAISGCGQSGPKLRPVSGKVTFQGKPVVEGSIRFSNPRAGVDIVAKLGADGTYAVAMARGAGLPEETYQIAIVPNRKSAPTGTFVASPEPNPSDIPPKYRDPATSGLTMTVKPESNVFDVDMQKSK